VRPISYALGLLGMPGLTAYTGLFDAVWPLLNNFARIPVCGLIAHYNATELPPGPDRLPALVRDISSSG
jgi:NADPH-dependent curcumin reductase CurA